MIPGPQLAAESFALLHVRFYVGVTDRSWFEQLSAMPGVDEVNFWQPGGNRLFRTLQIGEPFLFKLHSPDNFVVGGGFFSHSSIMPASLAWGAFGAKNGRREDLPARGASATGRL